VRRSICEGGRPDATYDGPPDVICHCTKIPAATQPGTQGRAVLRIGRQRAYELPMRMSARPVTNGDFPGISRMKPGLPGALRSDLTTDVNSG